MFKALIERIRLTRKLKELNKIPDINKGGCAIVAYGLVEYLKKNCPNKDAKVYFLLDNYLKDSIENGKPNSCGHAVVRIDDKYYDSDGAHTLIGLKEQRWYSREHHIVLDQNTIMQCIKTDTWNRTFDRVKHVPTIDRILGTSIQHQL